MKPHPVSPIDPVMNNKASFSHDEKVSARKKRKKSDGRPKRPLSAYNIFFQLARARIQAGDRKLSSIDTLTSQDLATLVIDRSDTKDLIKTKNPQEASVKMGFKGLATAIASKWKCISPSLKALFMQRAHIEKIKFDRELAIWKHLQLSANSCSSLPFTYQQDNSLLQLQRMNKNMIATHPSMGVITPAQLQQLQGNDQVGQTTIRRVSMPMQSNDAGQTTIMFLPPPNVQTLYQPGNATMIPSQVLQEAPQIFGSQMGNTFHRQVSSGVMPTMCTNQATPQLLFPQRQNYTQVLAWQPLSEPTVLGATSALYSQSLQQFHINGGSMGMQQVPCSSLTECPSSQNVIYSGQGMSFPTGEFPIEQIQQTWDGVQRIVSPLRGRTTAKFEMEMAAPSAPLAPLVDTDADDQSAVTTLTDHYNSQDELEWQDVPFFEDQFDSLNFSAADN
ncbi:hypothetical protein FisN_3Hh035 [Fistulifera solaris]|uniref:HMG box domain-containing protein n=1 Tax=Fistulifera solaris TaxID=1519565 RepID=A0A1Z5JNH6_FISSO|nr:hypothetical protein FisN_3Hh035 [Fistulifera solaris]|eukprot:GAX15567.1 hypothetical protein FisN_3Hh035 [Fistulifera solaris]